MSEREPKAASDRETNISSLSFRFSKPRWNARRPCAQSLATRETEPVLDSYRTARRNPKAASDREANASSPPLFAFQNLLIAAPAKPAQRRDPNVWSRRCESRMISRKW